MQGVMNQQRLSIWHTPVQQLMLCPTETNTSSVSCCPTDDLLATHADKLDVRSIPVPFTSAVSMLSECLLAKDADTWGAKHTHPGLQ